VDLDAVVVLLVDPHPAGARISSWPSFALDERLATVELWERPAVLDEPRDAEGVPPRAWWTRLIGRGLAPPPGLPTSPPTAI